MDSEFPTFICCLLWSSSRRSRRKNTLHIYTHHTVPVSRKTWSRYKLTQRADIVFFLHGVGNGLSKKEPLSGPISLIPGQPAITIKPDEGGGEVEGIYDPSRLLTCMSVQ